MSTGVPAVVAEADLVELDGLAVPRQGRRVLAVDDPGRAVHHGADPVGGGRGALDLGVDVGQLADRVGDAGQHGVERQQVLDRHRLRGELEPEDPQVQEDRPVQDQVRAGQQRDGDGRERQHLEHRVGHGVDHGHPDALLVQVLGLAEEPPPLDPLHGERLDDLDPLEALLEDLVDRRHALQRAADGPLHDLADAVGRRGGDRHQDRASSRVSRQLNQMRRAQAGRDPHRLADQLAHQGVEALAERVHVVGEPRHQLGGALVGEAREVQVDRAAEEAGCGCRTGSTA